MFVEFDVSSLNCLPPSKFAASFDMSDVVRNGENANSLKNNTTIDQSYFLCTYDCDWQSVLVPVGEIQLGHCSHCIHCGLTGIPERYSQHSWSAYWSAVGIRFHPNHLGRGGLRWNDGQLMTCYTNWKLRSYDNMPTSLDDLSVLFVWGIASKLFTQEMVSINVLFDCSIIKYFTQFYADISHI